MVEPVGPAGRTFRGSWLGLPQRQLKRILGYGAARALVELLMGGRGVALAALLGPVAFGTWSLLRVSQHYLVIVGLGMNRGLEVEASAHRDPVNGRPNPTAEHFAAAGNGFLLLSYGAFSALALAAALLAPDPVWRAVLGGLAAATVVERAFLQGATFLRAQVTVPEFAAIELSHAMLQLVLTLGLALLWGLPGAIVGMALAYAGGLAMMRGRVPMRIGWSWPAIRTLIRIGLPVTLASLMQTLVGSLDRLIVAAFLGVEALGQYAFAVSVASIGAAAGLVVRTAVFPDVFHAARHGGPSAWVQDLERLLLGMAWVLSVVLIGPALAIAPLITSLVPDYVAAIGPARIFIFSGVANSLMMVAMLGSVAAERQRQVPLLTAAALGVSLMLAWAALRLGLGLEGFAAASLATRLAYALGLVALGRPRTSWRRELGLAVGLALPVLAACGLVYLVAA
jgi:O-antigen/teichoic acid export membrane protein